MVLDRVADAQAALDAALSGAPLDLAAASLLPGWTRAHVLAHLAGNARANAEMVEALLRGSARTQYDGRPGRRAEEIDRDAALPPTALLDLVRDTGARWAAAYGRVTDWDAPLTWLGGPAPARRGPLARWRELEVHHVDLDVGYTPDDWPAEFVAVHLERELRRLPARAPGTRVPDGSDRTVLAWLLGRGPTDLPALPAWG